MLITAHLNACNFSAVLFFYTLWVDYEVHGCIFEGHGRGDSGYLFLC